MNRMKDIQPVGAISNILRAKQPGKVRLFKRPEYLPNPKRKKSNRPSSEEAGEEAAGDLAAEGLGKNIDFKV